MTGDTAPRIRVTLPISSEPMAIYRAFVEPEWLVRFWLSSASASLAIGTPVTWTFMVEGASDSVTATRLEPGRNISVSWTDGTRTSIDIEPFEGSSLVTVTHDGLAGTPSEQLSAALEGTEGFTLVLCDLKTLLETGQSAGLTRAKSRLIEHQMRQG